MSEKHPYNEWVAEKLEEVAGILQIQKANPFRIDAYRRAAETVRGLKVPLDLLVREDGVESLDNLPGIGQTLARRLFQLVMTGRLPILDRLRGTLDPVRTLSSVPGVGRTLAIALHDKLGIDTLEELEAAAHDGRLRDLEGFGEKRIAGIKDSLATRLGRLSRPTDRSQRRQQTVWELLDVDREYREKAHAGILHMIAPRRFNPRREAWLPILHTTREGRHYTVLFSNTAKAHELNKTSDWVVIYCETDHTQRQFTVVTATHGVLRGRRVVRGRESECYDHYTTHRASCNEQVPRRRIVT